MRDKLERLLEFQKVELEIERINTLLDSVPEKLNALDDKQRLLQDAFDGEAAAMNTSKKKFRDMEVDVQTNVSRISKSRNNLSAVKTNKEYQALLKEIDDLEEKNSNIEDEMIECLEQMESAETELAQKKETLVQLQSHVASEKDAILKEAAENERRLEESKNLQMKLSEDVDKALMSNYLRVKNLVKGSAVTHVHQSVCQGCHLNIPPQMFIELQRGDQLKFCPHCGRIIFWNDVTDQ